MAIPSELYTSSRRKLKQDQSEGSISTPTRAPASTMSSKPQTAQLAQDVRKAKSGVKTESSKSSSDSSGEGFKKGVQDAGRQGLSSGGGDGMDTAGNALMMSGNPYAMAAGGALKVIGAVKKKKEAAAQRKADDENNRRAKLQTAMANLGSGIGSIGMA